MKVLGIETSCDETAASVLVDGGIASNIIYSQIETHCAHGGVVPEIAAREHTRKIATVIHESFQSSQTTPSDIDAIAVTRGPGLVGSLLVGMMSAKGMAYALNCPIIGVNHIEAHLYSPMMSHAIEYPFIGLIVSGGHTLLVQCDGFGAYRVIGRCLDDAAGEAFDKGGKIFSLPYPAGPKIDKISQGGDAQFIHFPRGMLQRRSLDFSFSGVKTALMTYRKNNENNINTGKVRLPDVIASYQEAILDVLVTKAIWACEQTGIDRIAVSGGVACNHTLRKKFDDIQRNTGISVYLVRPDLATDNGAMVAYLGWQYLTNGRADPLDFEVNPNLSIGRP